MKPRNNSRMNSDDARGGPGGMFRKPQRHLEGVTVIDYKDHELLRKFMTERGKVMPRRLTGATAKQQRQLRRAVRRARVMGLLP